MAILPMHVIHLLLADHRIRFVRIRTLRGQTVVLVEVLGLGQLVGVLYEEKRTTSLDLGAVWGVLLNCLDNLVRLGTKSMLMFLHRLDHRIRLIFHQR